MPLLRAATAALAVASLLAPAQAHPFGAMPAASAAPRDKDLERAEKVIAKLRTIESAGDDFDVFKSAVGRAYPGLFREVAALRESDLKTDLATAVFLYEAAWRAWRAGNAPATNCDDEARPLYQKLCREHRKGTRAQMLRAKARLHTRWAESGVNHALGRGDAETLSALAEVRAERDLDLALAARAVSALKSLERDVRAYVSLAGFEEGRAFADVPIGQFSQRAAEAFRAIDRLLASLPRGPVRQTLQNARNSYRDGLFWWRKAEPGSALVVSAGALAEPDPLEAARIDAGAARYTVVVNWRSASKFTARAEELIRSSMGDVALRTEF